MITAKREKLNIKTRELCFIATSAAK